MKNFLIAMTLSGAIGYLPNVHAIACPMASCYLADAVKDFVLDDEIIITLIDRAKMVGNTCSEYVDSLKQVPSNYAVVYKMAHDSSKLRTVADAKGLIVTKTIEDCSSQLRRLQNKTYYCLPLGVVRCQDSSSSF